ncbi:CvpA family protein [Desulfosporosinus sp. BICA1-9]|uniref:CvpA family protein n=1 Tax=Desulfosporosinus sp. BICA1-9 TaxID=1531958 RepID=UPI00054B60CD|nr:CvpA family protein [Desulfosporosinus sp. BICA1-9]KJS47602.1 MAG: membrane protein [Peptococcaceae bacterium BRH_c23]KJS89668.1 MAG: membrane protein [Desulfosporosinus sp. BICA1-9]HBW37122.1 CvpA family protein [Desulfosporosinus sp.]
MNLLDVLILGFILLGALRGYQRGLLTSIVNFLSGIAGFLVAVWQYKAALRWVEQYFPLQQWLEPVIFRVVLPAVQSKADTLQQQFLGSILSSLPPELRSFFSSSNLPSLPMPQTIEQVSHHLAGVLTERILNLIAFGVVFYTVVLIFQLGCAILLRPFGSWRGSLNRGGGLLFGGLGSLIGLSVLAGLFSPLLNLGVGQSYNVLIQNSYFYPYLVGIFNGLDQIFSAQLRQNLLDPLTLDKGDWF